MGNGNKNRPYGENRTRPPTVGADAPGGPDAVSPTTKRRVDGKR